MNTPMNIPNPDTANADAANRARPNGRRRGLMIGGAAGLLGGGLVGLAMTLPSFTNAASVESGTVAIVDDSIKNDSIQNDGTGSFDPAGRLREVLQALVDDGTITADQADVVVEHLVANAPQHRGPGSGDGQGGRGGHHRPAPDGSIIAEVIGIDAEALRAALQSGQSLAEIAEANGVDVQIVIDALVVEAQTHLDRAVESGRLTEDEASAKAAELAERITARVNGEVPPRR